MIIEKKIIYISIQFIQKFVSGDTIVFLIFLDLKVFQIVTSCVYERLFLRKNKRYESKLLDCSSHVQQSVSKTVRYWARYLEKGQKTFFFSALRSKSNIYVFNTRWSKQILHYFVIASSFFLFKQCITHQLFDTISYLTKKPTSLGNEDDSTAADRYSSVLRMQLFRHDG